MFKHYFERIQDIEIWPIISLILFFVFFVLMLLRIFTMDKDHVRDMKHLPFEEGELDPTNNNPAQA
jgi:cytochrome c oxidase cbb3-type subunit IV